MGSYMKKSIAERELLYSLKGKSTRQRLVVRISAPYLVDGSMVNFKFDPGTAGCTIEFDGLPDSLVEHVYGADSVQALALAADIDSYLQGMSKKYDFYWVTGEPYFEE
jgi:hypothetical protein